MTITDSNCSPDPKREVTPEGNQLNRSVWSQESAQPVF